MLSRGLPPRTRAVVAATRPQRNGLPRRPLPTAWSQLDSDPQRGHFPCGHKRVVPRLPQDTAQAGVPVWGSVPSQPLPRKMAPGGAAGKLRAQEEAAPEAQLTRQALACGCRCFQLTDHVKVSPPINEPHPGNARPLPVTPTAASSSPAASDSSDCPAMPVHRWAKWLVLNRNRIPRALCTLQSRPLL